MLQPMFVCSSYQISDSYRGKYGTINFPKLLINTKYGTPGLVLPNFGNSSVEFLDTKPSRY